MKLIDKSVLTTELENRIKRTVERWKTPEGLITATGRGILEGYNSILSFINTLETKEVNLEEALSKLDVDIKEFVTTEEFEKESKMCGHYWAIAKHAFLLGIKAQNENIEPIPLTTEFNNVPSNSSIDWQQVKINAAIAALQGVTNNAKVSQIIGNTAFINDIVEASTCLANSLVKQLKK